MLLGGHGNISVTANVAPRAMRELCDAALAGDARRAAELHLKLLPLHKQLFCEPSPAPAKWALSRLGRCGPTVRLPLVEATPTGQALVDAALADCGIA
jgi:4-hydroxy-tetrahydrodipicolinate synthase